MLKNIYNKKPDKHKSQKLAPHLNSKTNYVVHYRNLQYYVELGMVVTRIHRVLTFVQVPWLKSYIEFNIEQRKKATTPFARLLQANDEFCIWQGYGK